MLVCVEFYGLLHSVISRLMHSTFSGGNSSFRDSSSMWIFLIHLNYAPHGNQVFETQFAIANSSLKDSIC